MTAVEKSDPRQRTAMIQSFAIPISAIYVILAMAACSIPTTPQIDGLRLTLELAPGVLMEGGEVEVILTISNVSRKTVQLQGSSTCPPFGFYIVDSVDQPYADPRSPRICTLDSRSWQVEPGDALVRAFRWTGSVQSENRQMRLAPGSYELQGVVLSPSSEVVSEAVKLEVVPGAGTQ
jgi:hypothetical protein